MSRCACGSTDYDPDQGCCFECFCGSEPERVEQFEDRPRCCTCNDKLAIKEGTEFVLCPDCQGGENSDPQAVERVKERR